MGRLVLSRRTGEELFILTGEGVKIEFLVAQVTRDKVDIAIKAPRDFKILKKETYIEDLRRDGVAIRNQSRQRHKRD